MKKSRALFLFVLSACASAQYGQPGSPVYLATPSQMDSWDRNLPVPAPAPAEPPSGETVSLVRLRHKPPAKARDAFARGIRFDQAGAIENAAAEFEKAIALDPEFSEAHGNLGVEYSAAGRLAEAAAEFRRAMAIDPATSVHHSNLALVLVRLKQNQEAENEAQAALSQDSTNASGHLVLGLLWAQRPEKSSVAESQLLYAARSIPAAHLVLAQIYTAEGAAQTARAELDHYLQATTPTKKIAVNRGQAFLSPR